MFKVDYSTEKYITFNLDRKERSYMAQLRMGILPLRIETGRYKNEEVHERVCNICNENVVEDEIHFMFNCNAYTHIRQPFFESLNLDYFDTWGIDQKLKYLFENRPRQTSKYIIKLFEFRKSLLYIV